MPRTTDKIPPIKPIEINPVFPVCKDCDYVFPIEEKGLFKKIRHAGCSAQGYRFCNDVYGTVNCKGIFAIQQSNKIIERS